MYDLATFKKLALEKVDWLLTEVSSLRTGRATPALLDGVFIEVYGSRMKLNQVANITIEDARTLYVSPWDREQVKAIEKAITLEDLGVSVGSDDKGIRVSFPMLTEERRHQLIKLVRGKLEEARIQLRSLRSKAISDIEKDDSSEDEVKRLKAEVQKVVDEVNGKLEVATEKKEADLAS